MSAHIKGHCPACGTESLSLRDDGYITCGYADCTEPGAVSTLLADGEREHVVEFSETTFTVRHPLRERLRDQLWDCKLHDHLVNLPGPPVVPGRYRAWPTSPGKWAWGVLA